MRQGFAKRCDRLMGACLARRVRLASLFPYIWFTFLPLCNKRAQEKAGRVPSFWPPLLLFRKAINIMGPST